MNLDKLFSLTPEDPNANYVASPSGSGITPQDEAWHLKNAKAIKAKELTNKQNQKANLNSNVDFFSNFNAPVEGEQMATPQGEINQTPRGETYKPVPVVQPEAIDVQGNYATNTDSAEKKDKLEIAKQAVDSGSGADIWGRLIVGLTPYALEGLFGGGKWMGSAGKGSAEGSKIFEALDKDRRTEAQKKSQFQLELDRKNQEAMREEKLKRDQMNAPNYTQAKEVIGPDGKPVLATVNTKTGDWKQSNQEVPPKPMNERYKNSDAYLGLSAERLDLAKTQADLANKQKAQVDMAPLIETHQSIMDVRNRVSESPSFYKNAADPNANSPEAQIDKATMNRLLNSEIFLKGGKTLTANERAMIAGPAGVVPFGDFTNVEGFKSWLASNPENARRFHMLMEKRYDQLYTQAQKANTSRHGINYAKEVAGDMVLTPVQSNTATVTPEQKLLEAKKRLGL